MSTKQTRTRGEDYQAPTPVPKTQRTRGRIADYDDEVVPEAAALAQQGLTDKEIAEQLGVHVSTFWRWFNEHPHLREAVRAAGKLANGRVRMSLYQRAVDGSDTAQIFWLKNREPDEWRDRRETEIVVPMPDDAQQLDSRDAALAALSLLNEAMYDPVATGVLLEATANAEENDDGEEGSSSVLEAGDQGADGYAQNGWDPDFDVDPGEV